MAEVVDVMTAKGFGLACVLDAQSRLVGIITDGDLRRMVRKFRASFFRKAARDGMTASPVTISRKDLATEALNLMERRKITSLVVVHPKGGVEGIVHLHDLWRTEMF